MALGGSATGLCGPRGHASAGPFPVVVGEWLGIALPKQPPWEPLHQVLVFQKFSSEFFLQKLVFFFDTNLVTKGTLAIWLRFGD